MIICLPLGYVLSLVIAAYVAFSDDGDKIAQLEGFEPKEFMSLMIPFVVVFEFFFQFTVMESLYQKFKEEKKSTGNVWTFEIIFLSFYN